MPNPYRVDIAKQAPVGADFVPWRDRVCPDCASATFRIGARGGLCTNIACARCGSRFNVTIAPNWLLLIQRI